MADPVSLVSVGVMVTAIIVILKTRGQSTRCGAVGYR